MTKSAHDVVAVNNNFEGKSKLRRVICSLGLVFKVWCATRQLRPAVMYLSLKRSLLGATTDLLCVIAYRTFSSGPVVLHLHGADLNGALQSRFKKLVLKGIWRYVTDLIILSPTMAIQVAGLPKRRVHVIPNFSKNQIEEDSLDEKVRRFGDGTLRVLYLSNIMFTKGFSYLVDAVNELRRDGVDVILDLAGRPLSDEILSAVDAEERLNVELSEGITYLGVINGCEKWAALEAAHVVALPTFYPAEAQPICLIEGMAFGCIPLTTRHNYNEDFLDERFAVFVNPKNSQEISDALRAVSDTPECSKAKIRLAYETATIKHNVTIFVRSIDHVLDNAVTCTMHAAHSLQKYRDNSRAK